MRGRKEGKVNKKGVIWERKMRKKNISIQERKSRIKRKKPQRPIFTSPCRLTIVSAVAFHCQVRDGSGWVRYALATTLFSLLLSKPLLAKLLMYRSTSKNEYRNGCFQLTCSLFPTCSNLRVL